MKNEKQLSQLTESRMVMSRFVHEIRNPLALISCELQMLINRHPESENWEEISDIQEHLTYLKKLISELSDYSNANRLIFQSSNMNDFLNTIADSFRPMFEYLEIHFHTEFAPNLPDFPVDTLRLRQALTNLLRNAEESITHNHGEIVFRAGLHPNPTVTSPVLHISIQDNGSGISPEQLPLLTTPFTTFKEGGTGLGLSIARQIIEGHGGTLHIESTPSFGTTIHLYLPSARMV